MPVMSEFIKNAKTFDAVCWFWLSSQKLLVALLQFDIYETVFYVFSVMDFSMIVVE